VEVHQVFDELALPPQRVLAWAYPHDTSLSGHNFKLLNMVCRSAVGWNM
jgi:hypothetical protein